MYNVLNRCNLTVSALMLFSFIFSPNPNFEKQLRLFEELGNTFDKYREFKRALQRLNGYDRKFLLKINGLNSWLHYIIRKKNLHCIKGGV